jgi:hypothetical protein
MTIIQKISRWCHNGVYHIKNVRTIEELHEDFIKAHEQNYNYIKMDKWVWAEIGPYFMIHPTIVKICDNLEINYIRIFMRLPEIYVEIINKDNIRTKLDIKSRDWC